MAVTINTLRIDVLSPCAARRPSRSRGQRPSRKTTPTAQAQWPPRLGRAFVAIPTAEGHVYDPVEEVVEDPLRRQMALNDMERAWKDLYQRYKDFAEFAGMIRRDLGEAA